MDVSRHLVEAHELLQLGAQGDGADLVRVRLRGRSRGSGRIRVRIGLRVRVRVGVGVRVTVRVTVRSGCATPPALLRRADRGRPPDRLPG